MKPEQREELKVAAMKIADTNRSNESISAKEYTVVSEAFGSRATPNAILSLIAQVEALTVPQVDGRTLSHRAVLGICDAYESGMGHGMQQDGHSTGSIFGNPDHGKAYEIGYQMGVERVSNAIPHAGSLHEEIVREGDTLVCTACGTTSAAPTIPAIPGTKEGA